MESLSEILEQVKTLCREAGEFILDEAEKFKTKDIHSKGLHDYVSYVDLGAEKMLVSGLKNIFPDAGFLTEEGTIANNNEKYSWVIDPLDGTTNFMHGLPVYSISVALTCDDDILLGVVYSVKSDEMFSAISGAGAWLNGKAISVSEAGSLKDMLVATGFPFTNYKFLDSYLDTLRFFIENTHGVRRMGSAAIDLAYVACGRFDAFFEYNLNPWDVCAGVLLIREAGGFVSDFSGGEKNITGKEIIASNKAVYKDFFDEVSSRMTTGN